MDIRFGTASPDGKYKGALIVRWDAEVQSEMYANVCTVCMISRNRM